MMGKVIMSGIVPSLVAPVTGIKLGDIAEGSIVKLNENGSPVEFYVAKHDYESVLNGSGMTLLVRKNCYDTRPWTSSGKNAYATSDIDSWLNETYKGLFDLNTQSAIGLTKFYYTPGNGNDNIGTLSRRIFLMSVTECGSTPYGGNEEGSELSIASTLRTAYLNGNAVTQWTRSPVKGFTYCTFYFSSDGVRTYQGNGNCTNSFSYGSRPCFTLPSGALFDEETMLFNGKIA